MERIANRTFYRYVDEREVVAIRETGLLRGGRGAGMERTFWTEDFYQNADEARRRLAFFRTPTHRVAFTITNEPEIESFGTRVDPSDEQPGGGTEWMSRDAVAVRLVDKEVRLDVD